MNLPRTGAAEWAGPQASPWDVVNAALRALDAGTCRFLVEDRDLTAPPGSCSDGACYLVSATATGAWDDEDGKLAVAIGANASNGWMFITVAVEGVDLYIRDENITIQYNGSGWVTLPSGVPIESFIVACSDETTVLTTGTAKITLRMPYPFTVTAVYASLTAAQTSGSVFTVDINEAGTSILSTKLTIDNGEDDSDTATTPAVISDGSLAHRAKMTFDIDQVGNGTAKGLKVTMVGYRT